MRHPGGSVAGDEAKQLPHIAAVQGEGIELGCLRRDRGG